MCVKFAVCNAMLPEIVSIIENLGKVKENILNNNEYKEKL